MLENLVTVTIRGHLNVLNPWQFGWHLIHGVDTTETGIDNLADGLTGDADFMAALLGVTSTLDVVDTLRVQETPDPTVPGEAPYEKLVSINESGTLSAGGGSRPPNEVCGMLKTITGHGGRRWHGRLFLPPARHSDDWTYDQWNSGSGYMTAAASLRAALLRVVQGHDHPSTLDDWDLTVLSLQAAREHADPVHRRVTEILVDPMVHWLRRRGS